MRRDVKQILDKLKDLGFGNFWEEFISILSKTLQDGDDAQIITKTGDGNQSTGFVLNIEKRSDELSFPFYKGTFIKVPDFEHKLINGIDSEALDALMQRLDWKTDVVKLEQRLEETGKGNEELIQSYHKAIANMVMLAVADEGKVISDALKIRYLVGTPYEQRYIFLELKEKCINERTFFSDTPFAFTKDEAANLLAGRAVLKSYLDEDESKQKRWFKTLPTVDETGRKSILFSGRQAIYPNYDLASVLTTLPMMFGTKERKAETIQSLQRGDLHKAAVIKSGKEEAYFIEANPVAKNINIYDECMKPVTRKEMLLDYKATNKKTKGKHL